MSQEVIPYKIVYPPIITAGVYYFTTDSGTQYEVRFGRKADNILHATIVFGVINEEFEGEEYSLTNRGELYRVMATIVKIILTYMKEHSKMMSYEFTAVSKDEESEGTINTRTKLYQRYLPLIFGPEWEMEYKGNNVLVNRKTF